MICFLLVFDASIGEEGMLRASLDSSITDDGILDSGVGNIPGGGDGISSRNVGRILSLPVFF